MSTQETVQLTAAADGDVLTSDNQAAENWAGFHEEVSALFDAFGTENAVSVSDDKTSAEWEGFDEALDECIAANEGLIILDVPPTTTSPEQAHKQGESPVRGSTSSLPNSLSPGSEHEEDTESNLGSELTPEEWAILDGEAPPPPPSSPPPSSPPPSTKSKSRKAFKSRNKGGKKKKGKSQVEERKDTIARLREDTLRAKTITSLDRAIEHIQSKVAAKTRQIFIDSSLPDIVMNGQTEAEDVMTDNDVSALPKLYHTHWRGDPNYRLLTKHMDLHNDVKLYDVYISLGLDVGRGKDLYEKIKQLLAAPGCSLRVDGDLTDEHKILVAQLAHELLAVIGWGSEDFQRPDLTGKEGKDQVIGQKTWGYASTDIFLGFCKVLYKAAKYHEGRRKGANRRAHNAEPAVAEPPAPQQEQQQQKTLVAEPPSAASIAPVPTITITAPSPSAPPPGPNHAINKNATHKRPHIVLDLTFDADDGGVDPSRPTKRARNTSTQRQPRQTQNVQQRPRPFVPMVPQTLPQSPQTLEQPQEMTGRQRQIQAQIEAYQRLVAQHNQGLPQHHQVAQRDDSQQQLFIQVLSSQQGHQNLVVPPSQRSQQIPPQPQTWPPYRVPQQPHTLPRNQIPQQPRALPPNHHQSPQRSQGLPQFQNSQGPQTVPQIQRPQCPEGLARQFPSPQRPQMMAPAQFPSPQRPQQGLARQFQSPQRPQVMAPSESQTTQPPPWAHLQSTHNNPPRPQQLQGWEA